MSNSNEYNDLLGTGYGVPEATKPEDEFFHSVYIPGTLRKNHIGTMEQPGKLQIRGVQYNLEEVNFIITHVKSVLVKREKVNERDKTVCFSYQNTKPWQGKDGKICPSNREDRLNTPSCNGCKGEIIISGILTDKNGKPILDEKEPIFIFIRGRGIKSNAVYEYLDKIGKMDIQPPIFPDNSNLEKLVIRNKRHVTNVKVGFTNSKYGIKATYEFTVGKKLDDKFVKEVLDIQKKTINQFNEKFDWSANFQNGVIDPDDHNEDINDNVSSATESTNTNSDTDSSNSSDGYSMLDGINF